MRVCGISRTGFLKERADGFSYLMTRLKLRVGQTH
jgi:hypothetical protein